MDEKESEYKKFHDKYGIPYKPFWKEFSFKFAVALVGALAALTIYSIFEKPDNGNNFLRRNNLNKEYPLRTPQEAELANFGLAFEDSLRNFVDKYKDSTDENIMYLNGQADSILKNYFIIGKAPEVVTREGLNKYKNDLISMYSYFKEADSAIQNNDKGHLEGIINDFKGHMQN